MISASPDLQAGSARPQYIATQAGSITPALGSKNAICSQVITFPNYSPSGAFRVLIRTLAQGDSSGTGQNQNFTSIVFDGTNTLTGAPWLIAAVNNGVNTWGTSDTFLSSATYAPGATVTFAYSINAAGGSTDFTITGSSMIITVEPA
ncbi:MAG: hypothetical protein B7X48_03270 [Acidiphilium sp. 34-60-192]|nr:MAG: hypothetical protein B7X48_03270 [Acidiphilium sp. 34-60-192]